MAIYIAGPQLPAKSLPSKKPRGYNDRRRRKQPNSPDPQYAQPAVGKVDLAALQPQLVTFENYYKEQFSRINETIRREFGLEFRLEPAPDWPALTQGAKLPTGQKTPPDLAEQCRRLQQEAGQCRPPRSTNSGARAQGAQVACFTYSLKTSWRQERNGSENLPGNHSGCGRTAGLHHGNPRDRHHGRASPAVFLAAGYPHMVNWEISVKNAEGVAPIYRMTE